MICSVMTMVQPTLTAIEDSLDSMLGSYFDAIGLLLMIRINYEHQLIMQKRCLPCLDAYIDKVHPRVRVGCSDEKVANSPEGLPRLKKMVLERWTKTKLSRRKCSPRYGLQSCRGKSAGVAKRPRELSPHRKSLLLRTPLFRGMTVGACMRVSPPHQGSSHLIKGLPTSSRVSPPHQGPAPLTGESAAVAAAQGGGGRARGVAAERARALAVERRRARALRDAPLHGVHRVHAHAQRRLRRPAGACLWDAGWVGCGCGLQSCWAFGFQQRESSSGTSPLHRPREDGLAHPAGTSRSNLAAALGLLSTGFEPKEGWAGVVAKLLRELVQTLRMMGCC